MPPFPRARPPRSRDLPTRSGPRVVLVTGASSGIGRSLAVLAAQSGDHVVLVARDEGSLAEVAAECGAAGAASTLVLPTDVGDDGQVAAAVTRVLDRHGRIDAVGHVAGVVAYGRVEEVPAEIFDGVLRTNLSGTVNLARHVVPVLRDQGHGALVLTGSVVGHLAVPGMSAYSVSKWGVRALARHLQLENRDVDGVSVSYVSPGGVLTPIYEQAANFSGWAGRPPPPVYRPETVARVILDRFDHPRKRTQVGVANGVMRLGFSLMPGLYDVLVGPLVPVATRDLSRPEQPGPGNVLQSRPHLNRLLGDQAGAVRGIARNLRLKLGTRTGR